MLKQVSNERTHGLSISKKYTQTCIHAHRKTQLFLLIPFMVFFFVSTDGFEQHPSDTNGHKIIFFLSVWSDAVFFFHSVLLVCSPSLPIFRKDLFSNITNDEKLLRDILNIWKKNYFQFCYWLWRNTLKLLQGLFIGMEERTKINDGFLKNFDDKFIGKCEYGNGHHLCLSKQWRQ